MHKTAQSVLAQIGKHDLLRAGDRVGAAVSGGADSVALLRLLLELRRELGIVISVVHLNHCLRGSESDGDEQFVKELAAAHRLPFTSESRNVKAYGKEKKLGLETAARAVRYEFFERLVNEGDLDKIATAHSLDDQAETVLLKLARGAGTKGMAGIYPQIRIQPSNQHLALSIQQEKTIIRPLLGTRRAELQAYLTEIGQPWREDSSNRDLQHTRNRVRHEILPKLEEDLNPNLRETLAETAEIARGEEEFWTREVSRLLPEIWAASEKSGRLKRMRMDALGVALQRRLVREAAESLGLSLEFQHVEDVLGLSKDHIRTSLRNGWTVSWQRGELTFANHHRTLADYQYQLRIPGRVELSEANLVIEARIVSGESKNEGGLLDLRSARGGLIIRNWRSGDRFWPVGAKATKKIKELLQDRQITGDEKKVWPVLTAGEEVVWVRGLGVGRDWMAKGVEGILISESPLA